MNEYLTIENEARTIYVLCRPRANTRHLTALVDALAPIYKEHKIYTIKALRAGGEAIVATTVDCRNDGDTALYQKGLSLGAAMSLLEQAAAHLS